MDAKLICLVAMVILGISSVTFGAPTCATCGGEAPAAAPAEDGGGEEEATNGCRDPEDIGWANFESIPVWCKDGTVGFHKNPPGKIGQPAEEGA
jgi:hypothetical protein